MEPNSPSWQMISPFLNFRRTMEPWLKLRKVPETPLKKGYFTSSSGKRGSPDFSWVPTIPTLARAPVGQETMHSPHEIQVDSPMGHVKTEGGASGLLSKLKSKLMSRQEHQREEESTQRYIPIDAPVDLAYGNPIAELEPGDLFGEMTCMSKYPRSATVRASTDCTVFEMLRNVLDILLRNRNFKEQMDRKYRQRAFDTHLRNLPEFSDLPKEFLDSLRDRVELLRFNKGQVICRQGDPADSFYLVRIGFVKVSESRPGGKRVLAYLPRGGYFGEMGLLGGGVRTATCTALDHVEVVRICADDFRRMMERFPEIRRKLQAVVQERQEQNRRRATDLSTVTLQDFLSKGLMEAQSLLVLDLDRCTRCDACVRACADAHDGVTRLVREGVKFQNFLVATSCRQCRDPLCMIGCPVGSIRRRNSLEIVIEDWCIGCGLCAENCPYGNINLHPCRVVEEVVEKGRQRQIARVKQKATTCDLCTEHAEPSCVYACPHDAAHRVDPNVFFAEEVHGSKPITSEN